jgi:integrase/recombinase XerD
MKQDITQLHSEFMKEQRYSAKLSKATLQGYESSFKLLIMIMPTITLETLSAKTLTEFFSRLEKRERIVGRGTLKKGIKRSTVATYRSKLNKFFDWLKSNKFIKSNPFENMEYPDVRYEDIKFLKKEEVEKIIIAIEVNIDWKNLFIKKRNLAIISTFLCCGIRKSELLGLRILDIDLPRRILTVRAETSKSRINRTIPLNTMVLHSLEDYFSELKKKNYSNPYLFASNNDDEKFTDHGLKHLVEFIKMKSGIKFHVHQFRHTFAVNMLNMGCDIAKLKQLMGHRDIRMTAVYLRCLPTNAMREDIETLTMDNLI